jgi:hypothetical protein
VQIEVLAIFRDDQGNLVWSYTHGETLPPTLDAEQNILRATGLLNTHLDDAKNAIGEQSAADLHSARHQPGTEQEPGS